MSLSPVVVSQVYHIIVWCQLKTIEKIKIISGTEFATLSLAVFIKFNLLGWVGQIDVSLVTATT
jgi:hypothetical protein